MEVPAGRRRPASARRRRRPRRPDLSGLSAPPKQRPQSCRQLLDRERLDQVVVRAGVETCDPILQRVARRQQQDRESPAPSHGAAGRRRGRPPPAWRRRARRRPAPKRSIAASAAPRLPRSEPRTPRAERALEHPADRGIVVDDENRSIRHDSRVRVGLGPGGRIPAHDGASQVLFRRHVRRVAVALAFRFLLRRRYSEIILETFPAQVSHWLHVD